MTEPLISQDVDAREETHGTLRLLVFAVMSNFNPDGIAAAHLLGVGGRPPIGSHFTLGDDLTYGESCDFNDGSAPAEFHHEQTITTGLWIVEWDWKIGSAFEEEDDADDLVYREAHYSHDRWSRPTPADLVAFGVLPS